MDPQKVEEKWKKFWEKNKIYKTNLKSKKIYSVDTPPPTVSGKMHIGHAFSYAQEDFIARFRRMFEGNVFYPFGTDDNGLPTERLVEKLNNVRSKKMSRAKFIDLCLKTLRKITPDFIQDWKDLGMSCDFSTYYSTIDKNSQKISQMSFIDLFNRKEIYQKEFPTLWCPECQTSIAQAELEDKEFESLFLTIKFSANGKDLIIATTRPEMIPACVAIFVNPKDKRYKDLIGKNAKIPLFNYEVPIIGDASAEIDKGTGVMMVCSYGDKYDVDAISRHKLKPRVIFNKDGTLNFEKYKGMRIRDARKQILKDLEQEGLIKKKKQIQHVVNVHDKCGTEIEFIPTEQWFIRILDKKKKLVDQGKKVNWYPKFMFKRYENWVNGLEWDWNISRDRHFGVPIPVWKCEECNEIILPKESELPVDPMETSKNCPKCKKQATPEKKVLDTWATASLTPQIASSLTKNKITIPYSFRPQGHDIIRTWAFYTIVKAYLHEKKIPWKDIAISGFVRLEGEKMSKSKGNVIEPQKVIKEYGADALRFWAAGSKLGEDLNYQEKDLVAGKRFTIKLQNASKFVFMNLKDYNGKKPKKLEELDKIFLKMIDYYIMQVTRNLEEYNYSMAKSRAEKLFWNNFTDYYLEAIKWRIYNEKGDKRKSAQYTLYKSLLAIVKMFAPITPFVTEEIYQTYFKKFEKEKSIHISKWPEYNGSPTINDFEGFLFFKDLVDIVKKKKSLRKVSIKKECNLTMPKNSKKELESRGLIDDFKNVINAREIKVGDKFKLEIIE